MENVYWGPLGSEVACPDAMERRPRSVVAAPGASFTDRGLPLAAALAACDSTATACGEPLPPAPTITCPVATCPSASRARTRMTTGDFELGVRMSVWRAVGLLIVAAGPLT